MKNEKEATKKQLVRSSAAEYLTYISAMGDSRQSIDLRYKDENIWITHKKMAELYGVSVPAIRQHLNTLSKDSEMNTATIKQYLIVQKNLRTAFGDIVADLEGGTI